MIVKFLGGSDKSFVQTWLAKHYTWDLVSAVKLMLGIDPAKDKTNIDLSGNEKASRIYACQDYTVAEKVLTLSQPKYD